MHEKCSKNKIHEAGQQHEFSTRPPQPRTVRTYVEAIFHGSPGPLWERTLRYHALKVGIAILAWTKVGHLPQLLLSSTDFEEQKEKVNLP